MILPCLSTKDSVSSVESKQIDTSNWNSDSSNRISSSAQEFVVVGPSFGGGGGGGEGGGGSMATPFCFLLFDWVYGFRLLELTRSLKYCGGGRILKEKLFVWQDSKTATDQPLDDALLLILQKDLAVHFSSKRYEAQMTAKSIWIPMKILFCTWFSDVRF